eukprot:1014105-Amphidinium_carterae.1
MLVVGFWRGQRLHQADAGAHNLKTITIDRSSGRSLGLTSTCARLQPSTPEKTDFLHTRDL